MIDPENSHDDETPKTGASSDLVRSEPQAEDDFDRTILRDLTGRTSEKGNLFGKDVELTAEEREQLNKVAAKAKEVLAPSYEDPRWKAYQTLVDEGSDKGVLMAFTTHPGTFVPTWCVDGGEAAEVKKIRIQEREDTPGIQVPSGVFNLIHWTKAVEGLEEYGRRSNEALKGTSTRSLGEYLRQLGVFLTPK